MNARTLGLATLGLVAAIAIGAVLWYALRPSPRLLIATQAPVTSVASLGTTAPEFAAATTAGYFDLATTDKPVFLEIFATWCPHCQRMSAVIDKLYAAYGSRVAFVGVEGSETGMDGTSQATQLDLLAFRQKFDVRYPVAFDAAVISDPNNSVGSKYLQGGFPTLAVIGRDKKISYIADGEIPYETLAAAIEEALR